jgi:hypothetical protein
LYCVYRAVGNLKLTFMNMSTQGMSFIHHWKLNSDFDMKNSNKSIIVRLRFISIENKSTHRKPLIFIAMFESAVSAIILWLDLHLCIQSVLITFKVVSLIHSYNITVYSMQQQLFEFVSDLKLVVFSGYPGVRHQ